MTLGNEVISPFPIRARHVLYRGDVVAGEDWTRSANSRAGTYPGQGFFLIGKTEIFTFLRGSWRARPRRSPRSGRAKPENLPPSEDVGGIALDRRSLRPPPLVPQAGVALAGPDSCRDRHRVRVEMRGAARAAAARGAPHCPSAGAHGGRAGQAPLPIPIPARQPGEQRDAKRRTQRQPRDGLNFSKASGTVIFFFFFIN